MEDKGRAIRLQKIREEEIPVTIEKYKSLIDGIFQEVSKPFPTFKDINITNEDNEIVKITTAEEQLYEFMKMREKAIDHADRMLNKINTLELELNNPQLFETISNSENDIPSEEPINPAKKYVRNK